jgi:hypothetical protein
MSLRLRAKEVRRPSSSSRATCAPEGGTWSSEVRVVLWLFTWMVTFAGVSGTGFLVSSWIRVWVGTLPSCAGEAAVRARRTSGNAIFIMAMD